LSCSTHKIKVPEVVQPVRPAKLPVVMVECLEGYACLDVPNLQNLIVNQNNSETYIKQLENMIKILSKPVEDN